MQKMANSTKTFFGKGNDELRSLGKLVKTGRRIFYILQNEKQ